MEKRKEGIKRPEMYEETFKVFKQLAEEAKLTLPEYFKRLCEEVTGTETSSVAQREHETRVLDGDFRETGRGKPKQGLEAYVYENKTYQFRLLDIDSAKDLELYLSWDGDKRSAYAYWWETKNPVLSQCNRHFEGANEWESWRKRCS